MKDADVDLHRTNQWLTSSGLKADIEGLIIAAQHQQGCTTATSLKMALTHYVGCVASLMNLSITSYLAAQNLPKTKCIQRRDNAASYIHWKVCQSYDIKTADKWYDHKPDTVVQ